MAAFSFSDKTKAIVGAVVATVTPLVAHFAGVDSDAAVVVSIATGTLVYIGVYASTNKPA
jgi:hypothetical protein